MHFIDGEPVGSINYAKLEEMQAEKSEKPAKPATSKGATVTSEDVKT